LAAKLQKTAYGMSCAVLNIGVSAVDDVQKHRIDWVDYSKGICIILVVMMHTTLGVEKASGSISWLNGFIEWAKPFRMPDFFLISGLFLSARIDKSWRNYFDIKVLHFAYFYILWMSIQMLIKAYGIYQVQGAAGVATFYAMGFIEPFGTLWFIYLLAVFFVVTKALRSIAPFIIFAVAALLEMAPIETGWSLVDEFASRYVYFFAGYWLAKYVFGFAERVSARSVAVIFSSLIIWAYVNYQFVHYGFAAMPGIGLALGFVGAAAVVSAGVLLSKTQMAAAIRYCGQNSIVIYLSFFLFMAAGRSVLLKFAPGIDLGLISLLVTAGGVIGPVLLFWFTRETPLSFLFHRPAWAKLALQKRQWHTAPHDTKFTTKAG
jgi:uncharacterized membrane protein YcfT